MFSFLTAGHWGWFHNSAHTNNAAVNTAVLMCLGHVGKESFGCIRLYPFTKPTYWHQCASFLFHTLIFPFVVICFLNDTYSDWGDMKKKRVGRVGKGGVSEKTWGMVYIENTLYTILKELVKIFLKKESCSEVRFSCSLSVVALLACQHACLEWTKTLKWKGNLRRVFALLEVGRSTCNLEL